MGAESGKKAKLGFAKQSAEGSAASNPTLTCGTTGVVPSPTSNIEEIQVASGDLGPVLENKTIHKVDSSLEMLALPKSVGYPLLGVFGTVATAGAGSDKTHTFTFADPLPFFTLFSRVRSDNWKLIDCYVDDLEIAWEAGKELAIKAAVKGKKGEFLATAFTDANEAEASYLRYTGANMKVDLATTPAATRLRNIKKGNIKILRGVQIIQTDDLIPQFVVATMRKVSFQYSQVYEDAGLIRHDYYGGAANSDPTAAAARDPVYGSVDFLFERSSVISLQVQIPKAGIRVGEFPKPNPGGDHIEVEAVGEMLTPSSGEACTAIVKNQHASYGT